MKQLMVGVIGLGLLFGSVAAVKAAGPETVRGKIVSVNTENSTFIVKPSEGSDITVTTDGSTKVTIDGKEAKLDDVRPDMLVEVALASGVARTITAHTSGHLSLRGVIVSVDAGKGALVLKPGEGANVVITTDADTKVKLDDKDAALADLKAGMRVMVMPPTGVAKTIVAYTLPENP